MSVNTIYRFSSLEDKLFFASFNQVFKVLLE